MVPSLCAWVLEIAAPAGRRGLEACLAVRLRGKSRDSLLLGMLAEEMIACVS